MTASSSLPGLPSINLRRRYKARRDRVFAAWTEPERFKKWFGSPDYRVKDAKFDLRVGGTYRFDVGTPEGGTIEVFGDYVEIEPPRRLAFTWSSRGGPADATDSIVSITLDDLKDATELILTHERLPSAESRSVHEGGWKGCFDELEQYLAESE